MHLIFDNQFTDALPADPVAENHRRQVRQALYSNVTPTPVRAPTLVAASTRAAALLGLDEADLDTELFLQVFAGNTLLPGMQPHATCYGGHQFGNWAGQLGDGRAINLGEVATDQGHIMLQLKGAGPTPYSRTADGLAVLRSSVREFLCSEAMHHLGVPTTRALSLITTGEQVLRDMLYDGNARHEPGAVVCRMSSSFVRFGHFQMLTARNELALLQQFTDLVIRREFPHLEHLGLTPRDRYVRWFEDVCERTAELMVHWMRVGFVHGVMNTDNMSILGETIDYGPYGWLEDFDPDWTPNTTDAGQRRYRYAQQPAIAQWNLMQLANAMLPLIDDAAPLEAALSQYARSYEARWRQMMADKMGLHDYAAELTDELLQIMRQGEMDMTRFYRTLGQIDPAAADASARLMDTSYLSQTWPEQDQIRLQNWLQTYAAELSAQQVQPEGRKLRMQRTNPKYVLRNYLAQLAIDDAERGEFAKVRELLDVLTHPYDEQPQFEHYAAMRPDWARTRVGCSMLSCSS